MLFEDAFVTTDREALVELFEEEAVLGASRGEARGGEQISRLAAAMWERDYSYVADPLRIVQARDTALVVARQGIEPPGICDAFGRPSISEPSAITGSPLPQVAHHDEGMPARPVCTSNPLRRNSAVK